MTPRLKLIANPVSGRGRAALLAGPIMRRLREHGWEIDYFETVGHGDARRFASEIAGFTVIACLGGDGTLNEVLNGLPERDAPPIAFLPAGTANVLAKELGLPRSPARLADLILHGHPVRMDVGINRRDGRKFLLFAGAGFDSLVVDRIGPRHSASSRMWRYFFRGLTTLVACRPARLEVAIDGATDGTGAAWVLVSKTSRYGGPLVFTPSARPAGGFFEVMIQRRGGFWRTLGLVLSAHLSCLTRGAFPLVGVVHRRGRIVALRAADGRRVPLQVDGDPGGTLPAELAVLPGACTLLVPGDDRRGSSGVT